MRGIHSVEYLENCEGSLAARMKMYEASVGTTLDDNYPVIIRVDGRSFSSYTKGFKKPFDNIIRDAMMHTARIMAEEVQGCKLVYSQSDEITLLITAFENPLSTLWFDGRVQKIVSNAASIATEAFNEYMDKEYWTKHPDRPRKRARFDARTFNLPFVEVNNCFIFRQRDAIRNSKLNVGMSMYSQKQLHKKNTDEIVTMLLEKGLDWNKLPDEYKNGFCVKKIPFMSADVATLPAEIKQHSAWVIKTPIPNFGEESEYVNNFFKEILQQ